MSLVFIMNKKGCFLSLHLVETEMALQSREPLSKAVMSNPGWTERPALNPYSTYIGFANICPMKINGHLKVPNKTLP